MYFSVSKNSVGDVWNAGMTGCSHCRTHPLACGRGHIPCLWPWKNLGCQYVTCKERSVHTGCPLSDSNSHLHPCLFFLCTDCEIRNWNDTLSPVRR